MPMSSKELSYEMLKNECKPDILPFDDTSQLEPLDDLIGQERAKRAMEFGLAVKSKGYNIYISGLTGTGKTSYAASCIKKAAAGGKVPDDWCYVYNFEKPNQPLALNLPAGMGRTFQKDMEEFIKTLKSERAKAFDSEDYEREKSAILKEFQEKRNALLEQLGNEAEKYGFKAKVTNAGIYFLPVIDGKTLSEQEYGALDNEARQEINRKSETVQLEAMSALRKIKNIEKEAEEKVEEWEQKVAMFAMGIQFSDLKEKYRDFPKVIEYLEKVRTNILENLDDFRDEDSDRRPPLPLFKRISGSHTDKYKVNLLVDNGGLTGAPVIVDFNPTYSNLVGKLEYENEFGSLVTDFTMIKPGLLHLANGGYLVLQAKDVLTNLQSWDALKRVLKTGRVAIENMGEQLGLATFSTLKPEPIPVDMKVVLIGNDMLYHLLYELDEDFKKFFKVKVDFDDEMERNEENILKLARFISGFCRREKALHFDRTGVARVVEYSSRHIEHKEKLSTRFNDLVEILIEANTWAQVEGCGLVTGEHVKKAIAEKEYRSNKYNSRMLELLSEGTMMIDTEGEVVGQVNGLSIIDLGDYVFGRPSRITATTYMGESGIVNIEREVDMSGTFHSKGVLILSGYIGQKYAQEIPLSLSASLCFEQLYSGVEGDSASSAELYAILSSLSDAPIKQSIAVTGSVNQKGEIQPVGGVTRKIEGFFELCRMRGLNGRHGVIIPHQNIRNLMLKDEVIEAVKKGLFHIYPVRTIDQGIEILTGIKAGEKGPDGTFPPDTINYRVYRKLRRFAETVASYEKK